MRLKKPEPISSEPAVRTSRTRSTTPSVSPGILKGALLVRAKKITDGMAIRASHSLADFAEHKKGFDTEHIMHRRWKTPLCSPMSPPTSPIRP